MMLALVQLRAKVPGVPPRLPRDSRRRSLLDAAARLFVERGYAGARLVDVAAATGVSRQLLQRHFATKRDLYEALLDEHRDALLEIVGEAFADAAPLSELVDAWLAYVESEPFAAAFLFEDTTGVPELIDRHAAMRAQARSAVASVIAARAPSLPEPQREALAELARSSAVGLARWWVTEPASRRLPRPAVVELLTGSLTAALTAAQHAAGTDAAARA